MFDALKECWNAMKAIWVYEWHKAKIESLARQAERTIVELKKDPYLQACEVNVHTVDHAESAELARKSLNMSRALRRHTYLYKY